MGENVFFINAIVMLMAKVITIKLMLIFQILSPSWIGISLLLSARIRYWQQQLVRPMVVMLKGCRGSDFRSGLSTAVHYAHLNCRGPMLMPICSHFCPCLSTSVLSYLRRAALGIQLSLPSVIHHRRGRRKRGSGHLNLALKNRCQLPASPTGLDEPL